MPPRLTPRLPHVAALVALLAAPARALTHPRRPVPGAAARTNRPFAPPRPTAASPPPWDDRGSDAVVAATIGRRAAIGEALSSVAAAILAASAAPPPAYAKEKEPITPETVAAAFGAVRSELEDPRGGVSYLESKVAESDFAAIMEFTKNYDLEFRKAKMGRARKLLTDKKLRDDAVLMCNAVTFDLIGMNKASREGRQNIDEVARYLGELKVDIRKFLELEGTVDFSAVE